VLKEKMQEVVTHFRTGKIPDPIPEEAAVEKTRDNFRKPLVEILILSRLCQSDSYSYEITRAVKAGSGGRFLIPEGSIYPALYRMMNQGYISDYQTNAGKRQLRVYYQIMPSGRAHLKALMQAYEDTHAGFIRCLAALGTGPRKIHEARPRGTH